MVGYKENASERLSSKEYAIAGALAGALTRTLAQPLDVLKIRFQLQVEPIHPHPNHKYWGVYHATRTIVRQEGVQALWKGHVPAQFLSVTYGLCQVAVFEKLTEKAWFLVPSLQGDAYRPLVHFSCASIAGSVACILSFPFDIVRTRLVAQGNPKIYRGIFHALSEMVADSGIRGLYRGLLPTVLQSAPYAGVQFGLYTFLNTLWLKHQDVQQSGTKNAPGEISFLIGGIAGVGAKAAVYPMDLAKKRMQMHGFEKARQGFGEAFTCSGFIHCLVKTARTEGFLALYKGFYPSLLKAGLTSSVYFSIYTLTCDILLGARYFKVYDKTDPQ